MLLDALHSTATLSEAWGAQVPCTVGLHPRPHGTSERFLFQQMEAL